MFNKQFCFLLFFLSFATITLLSNTGYATPLEDRVLTLQKKYQEISSLCFDFLQQTSTSGRIREGKGNAVFIRKSAGENKPQASSRKNIIRWNYTFPATQIILNTGDELSLYTEEDRQLIITPSDQLESDITFGLFSGTIHLLDVFQPSEMYHGDPQDKASVIQLIPKEPHAQLQRLQIWYSPDYIIDKLLMEDHFGSVTTLTFTNIEVDTIAADDQAAVDSILSLDLPEDTEIIRQE